MPNQMPEKYGDYRVKPIQHNDMEFNGVHYNSQGAWIGIVMEERVNDNFIYLWVKPILTNGEQVPAPENWYEGVVNYLSALDT